MSKDKLYYVWPISIKGYPWKISCMIKNSKLLRVHYQKNTSTYKTEEFMTFSIFISYSFTTILSWSIRMHMQRIIWFFATININVNEAKLLHPAETANIVLCTNYHSGCRNIMVYDNSVKITDNRCRTAL